MQPVKDRGLYRAYGWFDKSEEDPKKRRYHLGHDYNCNIGDEVKSITEGQILFNGLINGFGSFGSSGGVIMVLHYDRIKMPFIALYGHLDRENYFVKEFISEGQTLGTISEYKYMSDKSVISAPHLHLNIYYNMTELSEIKGRYGYDYGFNGTCPPVEYINNRT